MSSLGIHYTPISIRTVIGPISAFERPTNRLDCRLLDQFPLFRQISQISLQDKEFVFGANGFRFVSVVMPDSYTQQTREKVENLIHQFFEHCGDAAPAYLVLNEALDPLNTPEWVKKLRNKAQTFCLQSFGMRETPLGDFTDTDLKVLGYTRKEIGIINQQFQEKWGNPLSLPTLSCFEYALLKTKARGVKELLFTPNLNQDKTVVFECLQRWGFETVESPRKKDLVLYMRDGIPSHMGIYIGDGLVESKFGNDTPDATVHPLEMVYSQYGSQMAFYRKNPQKKGEYHEASVIKFVYK